MTHAGGSRKQPAWQQRVTRLLCNHPLVSREGGRGLQPGEVIESGWFQGVEECVESLHLVAGGELSVGRAFGSTWPFLRRGEDVFAPGMPVVAGSSSVTGADGEYWRGAEGVWREGAGIEELFLSEDAKGPVPGKPFDILWFGDDRRLLLRGGLLEIEDLFSVLRVPTTPILLERVFAQSRRLPEEVLDGVRWENPLTQAEIEVGRPQTLCTGDRWRNAPLLLETRADVRTAHVHGSEVVVDTERGGIAVFELMEKENGWRLERKDGAYPFRQITLALRGGALWLCGNLDPAVDPLAPGMRSRLAFDLRADLVALG